MTRKEIRMQAVAEAIRDMDTARKAPQAFTQDGLTELWRRYAELKEMYSAMAARGQLDAEELALLESMT